MVAKLDIQQSCLEVWDIVKSLCFHGLRLPNLDTSNTIIVVYFTDLRYLEVIPLPFTLPSVHIPEVRTANSKVFFFIGFFLYATLLYVINFININNVIYI